MDKEQAAGAEEHAQLWPYDLTDHGTLTKQTNFCFPSHPEVMPRMDATGVGCLPFTAALIDMLPRSLLELQPGTSAAPTSDSSHACLTLQ